MSYWCSKFNRLSKAALLSLWTPLLESTRPIPWDPIATLVRVYFPLAHEINTMAAGFKFRLTR